MPKMKLKTHRGAAKRFKKTGTGKIVRAAAFKRHILTSKPTKRKRHGRGMSEVSVADAPKLHRMLPYRGSGV
jgi:large subunit ribosomal protein L35